MFTSIGLPRKLFYDIYLKNPISVFLFSNKQYVTIDKVNTPNNTILDKTTNNDISNHNDNMQIIASIEKIKRQKYVENYVKYYNTHRLTSYIYNPTNTDN